ncbi:MAG TPA: hypothetical protein VL025_04425, partial [Thermoanaerobaculia bacterium]|nr:hypothetical protein [Thermoanaerobaculia bacterium]
MNWIFWGALGGAVSVIAGAFGAHALAARRRSIYVFHDQGPEKEVARLALGGGDQGGLYTIYRDPAQQVRGAELVGDDQWRLLRQLVEKADPRTI